MYQIHTLTGVIVGISDGRLARVSLQIVGNDKHKQYYVIVRSWYEVSN